MAGRAVVNDTGMIEHGRRKGAGYVADTAILSGWNVADIFLAHRSCRTISMAFVAVINSTAVIKHTVDEVNTNTMTYTAVFRRSRMSRRHSQGPDRNIIRIPIMTRCTITGDTRVIKYRGYKGAVGMTEMTVLARWQVDCCLNNSRHGGEESTGVTTFATI